MAKQPPTFEEMPDDIREIALEATDLRQKNKQIAGALEQLGAAIETGGARLEHLLLSLVELGIIDMKKMWEINLDWEETLNKQLREAHTRVAQQRIAEQRAAGKKKLILPGHM